MMYLERLVLRNFKSHEHWEGIFSPGINCISGPNGSGKTNILDAIYILSFCKSAWASHDQMLVKYGSVFFTAEGTYQMHQQDINVQYRYQEGSRKQVRWNNHPYKKLSEHVGLIPLVMAAPEDIMILMDGSESRRKVIDQALVQIDRLYMDRLTEYQKVLEQRNRLLKQLAEGASAAPDHLESWDERLSELGSFIFETRKKHFATLGQLIKNIYHQISGHSENFELEYSSALNREPMKQLLKNSFRKDLVLERTTEGIHRDDYIFHLNENLLRKSGSQGQQKTFVFALKLAIYQFLKQSAIQQPILLLDDLFEKLDESRANKLIAYLAESVEGQIFITDTHATRVDYIVSVFNKEAQTFAL